VLVVTGPLEARASAATAPLAAANGERQEEKV